MRYIFILFTGILILQGCGTIPSLQDKKEMHATNTIELNRDEADKAKVEYSALQESRRGKGTY